MMTLSQKVTTPKPHDDPELEGDHSSKPHNDSEPDGDYPQAT